MLMIGWGLWDLYWVWQLDRKLCILFEVRLFCCQLIHSFTYSFNWNQMMNADVNHMHRHSNMESIHSLSKCTSPTRRGIRTPQRLLPRPTRQQFIHIMPTYHAVSNIYFALLAIYTNGCIIPYPNICCRHR